MARKFIRPPDNSVQLSKDREASIKKALLNEKKGNNQSKVISKL